MEPIKVLIPTDFSVQAEYAYIMVRKLAEKALMEIHFLHILNVPDTVTLGTDGKISTCGEIDVRYVEKQKEIADRKLEEYRTNYGPDVRTHLRFGLTTETILQFAESQHFDLIAMGTKGSWGLKERFSGSETQIVARKSRVPLLSLMCDRSDLEIRNFLIVHNFVQDKVEYMGLLKKIVRAFKPTIHLLQIQRTPGAEEAKQMEEAMNRFAVENELEDVQKHIIQDSNIENGVVHFNQMHDMDIICIGTYGKGGLFYNSATERLINHMYKPIISFHIN
jgi:nucleotide-binding universal stress UspA family protein